MCSKCKINIDISGFHKNRNNRDGHSTVCKGCSKSYKKSCNKRTDPEYKLRRRLSKWLNGYKKGLYSSLYFIDYTVEELRQHLEQQFDENMSWDNYGSYWHIDHIIPISLFDLVNDEQKRNCLCLENLRPLERIQNISKGNKVLKEYIVLARKLEPSLWNGVVV